MRRILLVKTSSMGDVIHNLPVAGDLRSAIPDCRIDWIVEKAFAAIPAMHPAVDEIIPVSIRRWRSHPFSATTRSEFSAFRKRIRETRYDAVIDTQGLIKSALISWMANGTSHGLDLRSSREPLAIFYDHAYSIPWSLHAVERNRTLASLALGYATTTDPAYGIAATEVGLAALAASVRQDALGAFAVLLHATSASSKEWPEDNWIGLGSALAESGVTSVLPFGNEKERSRSDRLAARISGAIVPPRLGLDALAGLLSKSRIVVGVDTGLTHLAVALGRPTIGVYVSTDPAATGLYGSGSARNLGGIGKTPSVGDVQRSAFSLLEKL